MHGIRYGLVYFDIGTEFLACYPDAFKNTVCAIEAHQHFGGPDPKKTIKSFRSDNAGELKKAATQLGISNPRSTPYRSTTNAIAERRNRQVLEGIRTLLYVSGLPLTFWKFAARAWCHIYNCTTLYDDKGKVTKLSPWERRFRKGPFSGHMVPFGALVYFKPYPGHEISKVGPRGIAGIFVGYKLNPGYKWEDEYIIVPLHYF